MAQSVASAVRPGRTLDAKRCSRSPSGPSSRSRGPSARSDESVVTETQRAAVAKSMKGPTMSDRQLVVGVFPDEAAADNAAVALKDSGIAHGDAIGILVLDSHGK